VFPTPLKQSFDQYLAAQHDQMCDAIRSHVSTSNWRACDISATGELRAKVVGPNLVDLKYVVRGAHVRFDQTTDTVFGSWADPTIDATFDIEIGVTLATADAIDGAVDSSSPDYRGAPITIQPARVRLTNAHISTGNVAANVVNLFTNALGHAEDRLNQTAKTQSSNVLGGPIGDGNALLHDGAKRLGDWIRSQQSPATSNWFFNLDFGLEPGQLVLVFRRDAAPPILPTSCAFDVLSGDSVWGHCDNTDPDTSRLERLQASSWVTATGCTRAQGGGWVQPGCSQYEFLHDAPPTCGDPTRACADVVTDRVCNRNPYGDACGAPLDIPLPHTRSSGIPDGIYSDPGRQACNPPYHPCVNPGRYT
jgi:hypothetical protein